MPRPHRLDLYRLAVQHPEAEAQFLYRTYVHYFRAAPTRLREDFSGTAAVSAAWVELGEDSRALAIDAHAPTARWSRRYADRRLSDRAGDLHVVCADVMEIASPKVDVVAALNFSAFIYHTPETLLAYLRQTRRCLGRRGIVVLDVFGGPGAMTPGVQRRRVRPPAEEGIPAFTYEWEQRSYDHLTGRIDCRIHFGLSGLKGSRERVRDAFRYDWRLWTLPELLGLMREANFGRIEVWGDRDGSGRFAPLRRLPARRDFVAYVVGAK